MSKNALLLKRTPYDLKCFIYEKSNIIFFNSTYKEKFKAFEFDILLLRNISIFQACFESTAYVALSVSEPDLEF